MPNLRRPERPLRAERVRRLAAQGLSMAQAAHRLGVTRNTVVGDARDFGIRFAGAQVIGGGCDPEAARRGWATRRERRSA